MTRKRCHASSLKEARSNKDRFDFTIGRGSVNWGKSFGDYWCALRS